MAAGRAPAPTRRLTYALTKAPGEISLSAADTYQGDVAGETLPFLLSGQADPDVQRRDAS